MAGLKQYVSKITGKYLNDASSFHLIVSDTSKFIVTLGNPESSFNSTIQVSLPSDVVLKNSFNSLVYKGILSGGTSDNPTYTPDARPGDVYLVDADGYINTTVVEAGDMLICIVQTLAATSLTKEQVDANWNYIQKSIDVNHFSKLNHIHEFSLITLTLLGGGERPQGTISSPNISVSKTINLVNYLSGGTCMPNNVSTSLGNLIKNVNIDDDSEELTFNVQDTKYDKLDSLDFSLTTLSFSALSALSIQYNGGFTFTGLALTPHTHDVSIVGKTKAPLVYTLKYTTTNGNTIDINGNIDDVIDTYSLNIPEANINYATKLEITGNYCVATFENPIETLGINLNDADCAGPCLASLSGSNVVSAEIPSSVTEINAYSFTGSTSLETIEIPDSVTTIGNIAFQGCSNLETANIGSGVESIGSQAFSQCSNLTTMSLSAEVPPTLESDSLLGVPSDCSIYVPSNSIESYKTAPNWSERAAYILAIPTVELVDLGLSVKWAKYNLGATHGDTAESWYGNYYAWGEIVTKSDYSWNTYKFGASSPFSKYDTDGKTVLEAEDDVATVEQSLRIPTKTELNELLNNTTKQWVTDYEGKTGLNGYTFTANGTTLFIPAAGYYDGNDHYYAGNTGVIYSASLNYDYHGAAFYLGFNTNIVSVADDCPRCYGLSVRGVKPNDEE